MPILIFEKLQHYSNLVLKRMCTNLLAISFRVKLQPRTNDHDRCEEINDRSCQGAEKDQDVLESTCRRTLHM